MPARTFRPALWLTTAVGLLGAGCGRGSEVEVAAHAAARSPADAKQDELLRANLNRAGDPVLAAKYAEINLSHFSGALPTMPVLWEPRLGEVGALVGQTFTLEGMFGHVGKRALILLDPKLQNDPKAFARALCHEMAHAYLYSTGDDSTNHGPAFKTVLARLASEGAFEGVAASDADRANLRAWLDNESARLDSERAELARLGADIERERADVERDLSAINARISGGLPPPPDEIAALNARRDAYNQHATDANARAERGRADLAAFNREVARYNLMLVYPDGMDDAPAVPAKTSGQ